MSQQNSFTKNTGWIFLNSIWLIFLFIPLGLGTFASFFFIGIRANVKKWIYAGVIYMVLVITGFILINYFDNAHILSDIGVGLIMGAWLTAIGHGFSIRRKYLKIIANQGQGKNLTEINKEHISVVTAGEMKRNSPKENKKIDPQIINMNRATEKQISQLPAIHPFLAKEIIKIRKKVKKFKSLEHFARVTNVKPHILAKAKNYMMFSDKEVKIAESNKLTSKKKNKGKRKGRIVDY